MKKMRLTWFIYMKRRCIDKLEKRFDRVIIVHIRRGKHTLKKLWVRILDRT